MRNSGRYISPVVLWTCFLSKGMVILLRNLDSLVWDGSRHGPLWGYILKSCLYEGTYSETSHIAVRVFITLTEEGFLRLPTLKTAVVSSKGTVTLFLGVWTSGGSDGNTLVIRVLHCSQFQLWVIIPGRNSIPGDRFIVTRGFALNWGRNHSWRVMGKESWINKLFYFCV